MKIFITGSSGMVGRNLLENTQIQQHELITTSSKKLNLLNFDSVKEFLKLNKPEAIIHCAGKVGGIQANMVDQYGFFTENIIMGTNIVKAAKEESVKNFLNLSSSCTYPKEHENPLKEEYTLKGELEPTNEGYALAKLSILKMCEYITKEYNEFNYKTIIPCNLYGKYDKFGKKNSHMIPAVIKKLYKAKKQNLSEVDIWGDGLARREFMYAGDLAECIAKAIDNFESLPTIMNVGLGYDFSINEYYDSIKAAVGYTGSFKYDLSKPVGMQQKLLDITKQINWGFRAKTDLNTGILKTFNYYKEKK